MKEIRIPEDLRTYTPTEKEIVFTKLLQICKNHSIIKISIV